MKPLKNHRIPCMIIAVGLVVSLSAQDVLTVGDVSAKPGEKVSGFIRVPAGKDAPETRLPVTLIRGEKPGPVLALMAGVHACEYASILGLQRVNRELKPDQISGSVILVLVAHLDAFYKRIPYYNPVDWKNMNRQFPGDPGGTMSQRIAQGSSLLREYALRLAQALQEVGDPLLRSSSPSLPAQGPMSRGSKTRSSSS